MLGDLPRSVHGRLVGPKLPQSHQRSAWITDVLAKGTLTIEKCRSGTEGSGVDLLACHTALAAFVAERSSMGAASAEPRKKKPIPMGRYLDYNSVEETLRVGIREARRGTCGAHSVPSSRSTPTLTIN